MTHGMATRSTTPGIPDIMATKAGTIPTTMQVGDGQATTMAGDGRATGAASMSPTVAAVAVMPATALGAERRVRVRAAAWLTDRTARARSAVATVVPTTTAPSATATTLPARTTITSVGVPARHRCPLVRLAADLEARAVVASAADTPVVVVADALVADTDNTNLNTQLKTITNR